MDSTGNVFRRRIRGTRS